MAWTIQVIFPGIYNVSNGFMVIWLFGQFRWSSCNKLAIFSDLSEYHLLGALLEPSLPSRVEREETANTTFMGRLGVVTLPSSVPVLPIISNPLPRPFPSFSRLVTQRTTGYVQCSSSEAWLKTETKDPLPHRCAGHPGLAYTLNS